MRRRAFITLLGGAAAWPISARAQQPAMPVIAYLGVGPPIADHLSGLRKGLSDRGYVEGRNLAIEFRTTEQYDRLPALAAELVRQRVSVIVTAANVNAAQAARAATATIPIVFTLGNNPVRVGVVPSLSRPGGNATGVTFLAQELTAKRIEVLHELVPQGTTIAVLANPTNAVNELNTGDVQAAAGSIGQQIFALGASTANEIEMAFATFAQQQLGGLLIVGDAFFVSRIDQIVELAARNRIPAIHFDPGFTRAGGLMSYSDDRAESWRQAGRYVGRILKGEKPADLPVLQPTKFEFIINLKAAKVLGIEFPPSFHLRATEVIE